MDKMENDTKKENTPYQTSTGLKIGEFYQKKQDLQMSYDMELLQLALLDEGAFVRKEKLQSVKYFAILAAFFATVLWLTKN
jgi:hypothetical protein